MFSRAHISHGTTLSVPPIETPCRRFTISGVLSLVSCDDPSMKPQAIILHSPALRKASMFLSRKRSPHRPIDYPPACYVLCAPLAVSRSTVLPTLVPASRYFPVDHFPVTIPLTMYPVKCILCDHSHRTEIEQMIHRVTAYLWYLLSPFRDRTNISPGYSMFPYGFPKRRNSALPTKHSVFIASTLVVSRSNNQPAWLQFIPHGFCRIPITTHQVIIYSWRKLSLPQDHTNGPPSCNVFVAFPPTDSGSDEGNAQPVSKPVGFLVHNPLVTGQPTEPQCISYGCLASRFHQLLALSLYYMWVPPGPNEQSCDAPTRLMISLDSTKQLALATIAVPYASISRYRTCAGEDVVVATSGVCSGRGDILNAD